LFFFDPDDISDKVTPIAKTPIMATIQHTELKTILPWLLLKISLFLKKIPAPSVEPITNKTMLKKPIFLEMGLFLADCC
jgi:hypothetical protein